jgi:CheY-like chemotaxis protein
MMSEMKDRLEDWMIRVTFAEAGDPEDGFELTGEKLERKIKVALDKLIVVRTEKSGATEEAGTSAPAEAEAAADAEAPAAPPERGEGDALRVMIVDDEPIVGKRLGPALRKYGIEVEYFRNPAEAMERLDERAFDVVVTDMKMDEMNGLQVLEHVMEKSPATRVIMITGYGSVEVARDALTKGAFDFISKPFKPADLRSVINKAALSMGFRAIDE